MQYSVKFLIAYIIKTMVIILFKKIGMIEVKLYEKVPKCEE